MDKLTKKEKKELRHLEYEEKIKNELKHALYKKIGIWTTAIVIFCLAIWGLILITNNPPPPTQKVATLPKASAKDIVIGTSSAKVTLTEYADFQCPACSTYHVVIKQILEKYGSDIQYVYRNYPLSIHRNARSAAFAGLAAHKQDKFKEMEDLLYANQKDWSDLENPGDIFRQYAERIGLDLIKYDEDFASEETKKFITDQENAAIALGINSTPTFFVNNEQVQAPPSFEEFDKIIENAINKK